MSTKLEKNSNQSTVYLPVVLDDQHPIFSQMNKGDRRKQQIKELHDSFKKILSPIIMQWLRDNHENLNHGDVLLTIDIGKNKPETPEAKDIPELDLGKGKKNDKSWSLEQTLAQYFKGVPGNSKKLSNLSGYVINETLRYLHANPDTQKTALKQIGESTPFKPVLPNKIIQEGAFIIMTRFIPGDTRFMKGLNEQIASDFGAQYSLTYETIESNGSKIHLGQNSLTLSSNFINLVLQVEDKNDSKKETDDDSSTRRPILSQDDE